jgi:hypothetical protein
MPIGTVERLFDKQPLSMPFTKGKSGNPKGRPKDPIATNIREYIKDSIDLNKLNESLECLDVGSDYIQGLTKLLPFVLPRLNAIEMASIEELEKGIHLLSDAELGKLSNILINEYERRPISQTEESEQETN